MKLRWHRKAVNGQYACVGFLTYHVIHGVDDADSRRSAWLSFYSEGESEERIQINYASTMKGVKEQCQEHFDKRLNRSVGQRI